MADTIRVTDIAEFFRAEAGKERRYYAAEAAGNRERAINFDAHDSPTRVKGFGVYDTTVSTIYAVEVYPERGMAEGHPAGDAPKTPYTPIDAENAYMNTRKTDETPVLDEDTRVEAERNPPAPAKSIPLDGIPEKPARSRRSKRRD